MEARITGEGRRGVRVVVEQDDPPYKPPRVLPRGAAGGWKRGDFPGQWWVRVQGAEAIRLVDEAFYRHDLDLDRGDEATATLDGEGNLTLDCD